MLNKLRNWLKTFQKRLGRLNRHVQSVEWLVAFVIGVLICLLLLSLNLMFSELHPGNWWGLTYGTLAAILMFGAALYGFRRRSMKLSWGRSQTWLQFHIYGGTLCLLLILMHSGFQAPTGVLTGWLWALSLWVTISGLLGAALQKWVPKLLASGLSIEVLYHRIPELVKDIQKKAEKLVKDCDDTIQDFYQKSLAVSLAEPQVRWIYYIDITGGSKAHHRQFTYLRSLLADEEREKLNLLENYYRTKLEIDAHYTLQKALRWWLYLHVPVSIVLVLLLILHIYSVLWY